MNRRTLLALLPLGLIGCAAGTKLATKPAQTPHCVVCGMEVDRWNWYGDEGPFCEKHLEERMAKDRPKSGQVAWSRAHGHFQYSWLDLP